MLSVTNKMSKKVLTVIFIINMTSPFYRTDLARKYRTKMSEIELKRVEVMRLSTEFEAKLRQKEVRCSIATCIFNCLALSYCSLWIHMKNNLTCK